MIMKCKYCNKIMDYDSSEGMSNSECHIYICGCGASCIVHENGQEDS